MRKRDFKMLEEDEFYRGWPTNSLPSGGKESLSIVESDTGRAIADAEQVVEDYDMDFDIIFFDLPGTMNNRDLIITLRTWIISSHPCRPHGWSWRVRWIT
jgi:hypothetical protein